jgi:NTE family protein
MRLGLALETGRASNTYTVAENVRRLNSVALYLGGETPFGPVYVGVGHTGDGSANAYLFLGTP